MLLSYRTKYILAHDSTIVFSGIYPKDNVEIVLFIIPKTSKCMLRQVKGWTLGCWGDGVLFNIKKTGLSSSWKDTEEP